MNFLENALNFIFPPICGICGKMGENYICNKCKTELINSNIFLNKLDTYESNNITFIDAHFYLFKYYGIIREKILQYKFDNKAYLYNTISEFFINNKKLYRFLKKYDIITAVPISKSRKRARGYNQSELIARKLAKTMHINFEKDFLIKIKNNNPQSSLDRVQRFENVKNVYKIQNEQKIKNSKIILFDDIYTTGATVNECAKLLKMSGAKSIGILTIAKDF